MAFHVALVLVEDALGTTVFDASHGLALGVDFLVYVGLDGGSYAFHDGCVVLRRILGIVDLFVGHVIQVLNLDDLGGRIKSNTTGWVRFGSICCSFAPGVVVGYGK